MWKHQARILMVFLSCLVFKSKIAHAYPEFIGFGYTSCATCHYNTQGNGPLNDYGRALFAGEIAARDAFDESTTDDDLAAASGFLGKKELPWWLRPSFKYRGLWLGTNVNSSDDNRKNYYVMQEDANLTLLLNKDQKLILQLNMGRATRTNGTLLPLAGRIYPQEVWLSREHYIRWQATKSLWFSLGMLDKVFGIRLIDHTAFSRATLGLNNYENTYLTLTHGLVIQFIETEYEITGHIFVGNAFENTADEQKRQQKGFSFMYEKNLAEKSRAGFSVLTSASDDVKLERFALHHKLGLSVGSALLAEAGYQHDKTGSTNTDLTALYGFLQTNLLLRRGYNFLSLAEYYKSNTKTSTSQTDDPDKFRWGVGFLTFPFPRTEFRFTLQDHRTWSNANGSKDSWWLLGQLHLSL